MPTRKPPPAAAPPSSSDESPPDLTTIGGRLRYLRSLRGLGVKALAISAGLSTATAFQIETHTERDVRVGTLVALAEQLDAHPAWLAFGLGPAAPFPPELRATNATRSR